MLPLNSNLYVVLLQSSVLLLILSEIACTLEVSGEDQVVAVEVLNMSPVQMGNIRVSDLLAGLLQGKKKKKENTKHQAVFRLFTSGLLMFCLCCALLQD